MPTFINVLKIEVHDAYVVNRRDVETVKIIS
jgi:hypothetical protein